MPNGAVGPFDCIVLGAGIAGVTAARDLQARGHGVLLVEGSDRVGGRMYSRRDLVADPASPGSFRPVELGAEFIHVRDIERYEAFWDEVRRQGFTGRKYPKSSLVAPGEEGRNRVFFPAWGETRSTSATILDPEVAPASGMLFLMELGSLFDRNGPEDVPARSFARSRGYSGRGLSIAEYTLSAHTPGMLDDPPAGTPPDAFNPNDTISVAGILADEIQDQLIEPHEFKMIRAAPGDATDPGYDSLPAAILQEFLDGGGTLRKSAPGQTDMKVTRVERRGPQALVVTTRSGQEFTGRSAVCTFSVGMLDPDSGEGEDIFGDLLTAQKRSALDVVRMGPITKIGLEFRERKWAAPANELTVLSNPEGEARTFFSNFPDDTDTGPHMLTGLLMSKDHRWIVGMSDARAIQFVLGELQKIFDPDGAPWTPEGVLVGETDPSGVFRPRYFRQDWGRDEFAKGGNSYLHHHPPGRGAMEVHRARLGLMDPRETLPLFWAGEATAPAYDRAYQPLSVHGAWRSGARVAEDVGFWLTRAGGDAGRFHTYFRERYGVRTFFQRLGDFLRDLFQ